MRVLIAGGGTGGRIYTGMAVAEEVMARPGGDVLFVGTAKGLEARVVPAAGYRLELITVSGLKRVGLVARVRGLARLPGALLRSLAIVREYRPDVVLGVGGYASGPMLMGAALARRPCAILEQNTVPGFTNRALGPVVRTVFTAFEVAEERFPRSKIVRTGNPVRRAFLAAAEAATRAARPQAGPPRLLVLGGSQGARAVNDLLIAAVEAWSRGQSGPALRIVHQTGLADAERVTTAYAKLVGGPQMVEVRPFIEDMAAACAEADLVVARAGALTLAELAVTGKPAILIPLPTAADDHQTKNAAAFADHGAALLLPQGETSGERLAAEVSRLVADPSRRQAMAAAMITLARPRAAAEIADRLEAMARR